MFSIAVVLLDWVHIYPYWQHLGFQSKIEAKLQLLYCCFDSDAQNQTIFRESKIDHRRSNTEHVVRGVRNSTSQDLLGSTWNTRRLHERRWTRSIGQYISRDRDVITSRDTGLLNEITCYIVSYVVMFALLIRHFHAAICYITSQCQLHKCIVPVTVQGPGLVKEIWSHRVCVVWIEAREHYYNTL